MTSAISTLVAFLVVLARADTVAPYDYLPTDQAFVHGLAMVAASSPEVSEQEIFRKARHESGFWVDARPGMRHWPHRADRFPRKRHYVCGLMQATARTPAECVSWIRDPFSAYRAGADQLREWHRFCRRMGRTGRRRYACARAGYSLGVEAARAAS